MRISFPRTAAVLVAALMLAGRAAQAQALPDNSSPTIATVRAGAYFPFNAHTKDAIGKTWFGGGVDYALQQKPGISRTMLSVDYISRSSGGNTVRLIPITIGTFSLQGTGGMHPYFGIGVGAYLIHEKFANDQGVIQTTNTTTIGGYLGAGLDLSTNLLLEARYHILPKIGAGNSSGLEVMGGFRF